MSEPLDHRVEIADGVATVTFDRPQAYNAFTADMVQSLLASLKSVERDKAVRAVVLTGAGKAFCAGQALDDAKTLPPDGSHALFNAIERGYGPLVTAILTSEKPFVAAVNGVAAGAGANIALACDIVLAARSASFVQAFAKVGLVPDSGGTWFLPRLVGPARARGLALTAQPLPAEQAEAWGLIWKAVDDAALMAEAEKLCAEFATAATIGLALTKHALDQSWSNDLETQLELERVLQRQASLTPDYAEGVRAFMAKRKPVFTGRIDKPKPAS
jgi:2-(1,2-epoxy-1,2-dihydrophenyl)acetyl-CoA isomerase